MPDHSGRPSGEEMMVNGGILRFSGDAFRLAFGAAFWFVCLIYVGRKPSDRSRLWYLWIATAFLILVALPVLVDAAFHNIRLTLAIGWLSILGLVLLWLAVLILGILSLFQKRK